jgi:hypothetical protein
MLNENDSKNIPNLYSTLKLFKKYFKEKIKEKESIKKEKEKDFYNWLLSNTNYIKDYELLMKIYDIFDLTKNYDMIKIFEHIKIINGPVIKNEIIEILKPDGFIFIDNI